MLSTIKLILEPADSARANYNMASLFHGFLMEIMDKEYAGYLHQSGLKPFSQFLFGDTDEKKWVWQINFLTAEAKRKIGDILLADKLQEIYLREKNIKLQIIDKREQIISTYQELVSRYYLAEIPQRKLRIIFQTPCSFKSAKKYVFFPELALIFQSLMNKFETFAQDFSVKDQEALNHLSQYTSIRNYCLRSATYSLEGVKIPGFVGRLDIFINGPETMVNLATLLLGFAEWSGIGIKTALGMGAVKIE